MLRVRFFYLSSTHCVISIFIMANVCQTNTLIISLPWEVTAVMLADTIDGYQKKEESLISEFRRCFTLHHGEQALSGWEPGLVQWVERSFPRK